MATKQLPTRSATCPGPLRSRVGSGCIAALLPGSSGSTTSPWNGTPVTGAARGCAALSSVSRFETSLLGKSASPRASLWFFAALHDAWALTTVRSAPLQLLQRSALLGPWAWLAWLWAMPCARYPALPKRAAVSRDERAGDADQALMP